MANLSSLTIVDDNNLRGIIAPAKILSKELLEDMLDLIAYSRPKTVAEINRRFKKAEKEGLIDGETFRKSLRL
jgi:hypothetical protein